MCLRDIRDYGAGWDVGQDQHSARPVIKPLASRQLSLDGTASRQKILIMDLPGMNPVEDVHIAEATSATGGELVVNASSSFLLLRYMVNGIIQFYHGHNFKIPRIGSRGRKSIKHSITCLSSSRLLSLPKIVFKAGKSKFSDSSAISGMPQGPPLECKGVTRKKLMYN